MPSFKRFGSLSISKGSRSAPGMKTVRRLWVEISGLSSTGVRPNMYIHCSRQNYNQAQESAEQVAHIVQIWRHPFFGFGRWVISAGIEASNGFAQMPI